MKKSTLINEISTNKSLPKENVALVIDEAIKTITQSLVEGEAVSFTGFGSFCLVQRKAKSIYLPGGDEKIYVEAKNVVKFRPAKKLKDAVENAEVNVLDGAV